MTVTLELNQDQLAIISEALASRLKVINHMFEVFENGPCTEKELNMIPVYLEEKEQIEALQEQILVGQKLDDVLTQKFGDAFSELGFK